MLEFKPLRYPETWPPPDAPPSADTGHRLKLIPIIRWIAAYFLWIRRRGQHQRDVLDPIADRICEQLETRPADGPWPNTKEKRQIVKIISDAVCLEKGLETTPALHPEDPFPLLFWGPFDDITPMIVRMELRKRFKFDIPQDVMIRAWKDKWTIEAFIECCDQYRTQNTTAAG